MYEVCVESTMQLFLQSGILLFKVFYTEPATHDFMVKSSYVLDIVSITTSGTTMLWGLSSYKINVTQTEPKLSDKFILMFRSYVDIMARYGPLGEYPRTNLYFILFHFMYCTKDKNYNQMKVVLLIWLERKEPTII